MINKETENSVCNTSSVPRILDKVGTGASSTGKSLLEELHAATGEGQEKWESSSQSMCRDSDGESLDHYDSVRSVIGGDVDEVFCTSPRHSGVFRSEAALPIDTVLSSVVQPCILHSLRNRSRITTIHSGSKSLGRISQSHSNFRRQLQRLRS
jgi:hypothetical protein